MKCLFGVFGQTGVQWNHVWAISIELLLNSFQPQAMDPFSRYVRYQHLWQTHWNFDIVLVLLWLNVLNPEDDKQALCCFAHIEISVKLSTWSENGSVHP